MFRLSISLALCLSIFSLSAKVVQSDTIEIIKQHCVQHKDIEKQSNKNTFVVFDIDHTIGMWVLKWTLSTWFTHVFYPSWNSILDRLQHLAKLKPMEDCTVPLIKELQEQGFTVLVLTARAPHVASSTLGHLNGLDLDFSSNPQELADQTILAPDLKYAAYEKGVIFCNHQDKGKVLAQFLNQNDLNPDAVIFMDDLLENAHAVDEAMNNNNIQKCIAIHYTRKQQLPYFAQLRASLKSIFGA